MAKQLYDNTAYFSTLAFLFVHDKMTDWRTSATSSTSSKRSSRCSAAMQDLFQRLAQRSTSASGRGFGPLQRLPADRQDPVRNRAAVHDEEMIDRASRRRSRCSRRWRRGFSSMAAKQLPEPPEQSARINPLAVSLRPEKWAEEGLFTEEANDARRGAGASRDRGVRSTGARGPPGRRARPGAPKPTRNSRAVGTAADLRRGKSRERGSAGDHRQRQRGGAAAIVVDRLLGRTREPAREPHPAARPAGVAVEARKGAAGDQHRMR